MEFRILIYDTFDNVRFYLGSNYSTYGGSIDVGVRDGTNDKTRGHKKRGGGNE